MQYPVNIASLLFPFHFTLFLVTSPVTFTIGDLTGEEFQPYLAGGTAIEVKTSKTVKFVRFLSCYLFNDKYLAGPRVIGFTIDLGMQDGFRKEKKNTAS